MDDEKIGPTFADAPSMKSKGTGNHSHNLMRIESDANMEWETERQIEIGDEMETQLAFLKAQGTNIDPQQVMCSPQCVQCYNICCTDRTPKVLKKWTMT